MLATELADRLRSGPARWSHGRARWQPLDEAAREATPQGHRENQRALAYWRRQLSIIPAGPFGQDRIEALGPRYSEARLCSAVLLAAISDAAARARTTPATACLTAFLLLLSHVTGQRRPALMMMSANRFGDRYHNAVGSLSQPIVMSVEIRPDTSFLQLAGTTAVAWINAVRHARYSFDEMKELSTRTAAERGIRGFRTATTFNYRHFELDDACLREEQSTNAGEEYTVSVTSSVRGNTGTDVYLWVLPRFAEVAFELVAHEAIMSTGDAGNFLVGIHRILRVAATRDLSVSEAVEVADVVPAPAAGPLDNNVKRATIGDAGPAAVEALQAAIKKYHSELSPRPDLSFVEQGGRVLRAPAVRTHLSQQGYDGISCDDLAGTRTVRELARDLRYSGAGVQR